MNSNDPVRNDEELYCAVRIDKESDECIYKAGRYIVRSKTFSTRNQKPSVGRAELSKHDPVLYLYRAPLDLRSGVVSFIASVIRAIELDDHTVCVEPAPCPNNPAHAQIVMKPTRCVSNSRRDRVFGALRRALASRATKIIAENGWRFPPQK